MAVVGKTTEEVVARAETFRALAKVQLQQPDISALNVAFQDGTADVLAHAYLALSEAYKRKRLEEDHRTEWSKAAALVAAAVCVVNPLRPAGRADDPSWLYVNPAFGMLCAYGHAQQIFYARPFDERRRIFQALQGVRLPSLDPIIAEGNKTSGAFVSEWRIELSDSELSLLDTLVSLFALLLETEELRAAIKEPASALSLA